MSTHRTQTRITCVEQSKQVEDVEQDRARLRSQRGQSVNHCQTNNKFAGKSPIDAAKSEFYRNGSARLPVGGFGDN